MRTEAADGWVAVDAAKTRDAADLAALGESIGWDPRWLDRHCKTRRRLTRMVTSRASCTSSEASGVCIPGPRVVNRHHYKGSIPGLYMYIGRGSPLGNPYTVREHGDIALELYRKHLWARIRAGDEAVLGALDTITAAHRLVCSCYPRPCHGDVVVRAWRWRQETRP